MVNYRLLAAPKYVNSLVFSHIARHHSAFRGQLGFYLPVTRDAISRRGSHHRMLLIAG
jgi:hypothetical protein